MKQLTTSNLTRPSRAVYADWAIARSAAKSRNQQFGRGHRALKSQDGKGYAVVFRPAVAGNKQRRQREII